MTKKQESLVALQDKLVSTQFKQYLDFQAQAIQQKKDMEEALVAEMQRLNIKTLKSTDGSVSLTLVEPMRAVVDDVDELPKAYTKKAANTALISRDLRFNKQINGAHLEASKPSVRITLKSLS